jgi:hypothetical protein
MSKFNKFKETGRVLSDKENVRATDESILNDINSMVKEFKETGRVTGANEASAIDEIME